MNLGGARRCIDCKCQKTPGMTRKELYERCLNVCPWIRFFCSHCKIRNKCRKRYFHANRYPNFALPWAEEALNQYLIWRNYNSFRWTGGLYQQPAIIMQIFPVLSEVHERWLAKQRELELKRLQSHNYKSS